MNKGIVLALLIAQSIHRKQGTPIHSEQREDSEIIGGVKAEATFSGFMPLLMCPVLMKLPTIKSAYTTEFLRLGRCFMDR